jgi:hypothetical protein
MRFHLTWQEFGPGVSISLHHASRYLLTSVPCSSGSMNGYRSPSIAPKFLHTGNRGVHSHRGKPIIHHRISLPPAVITLFAKPEVFGRDGCGFMAGISGSRPFCGNYYADRECFPGFRTGTEQLDDLCGVIRHDCTAEQAGWGTRGMVTATGTLCVAIVAAARVQALMALATAATIRNLRRIGSRGGNIMGWSIADVFVGGVIYTLSAWAI